MTGREPILIIPAASVYVWIENMKKMDRFVTLQKKKKKKNTEASEAAGENESDDVPAVGPAAVKGKCKREKTRKYTDNYLKFGFYLHRDRWHSISNACHLFYCAVKQVYEAIKAAASLGDNPQTLQRQIR